ncbi:alpha/beta hydrolase [Photobacterium sp. WH77]|uniref:alpha/beta hydrolase n=1 Tax=Photobacterium TaxID=657 RepID=UPI001EDC63CE|nr:MULTISPECIES: alpha/beta fold hydrolase [Photobacterium]MCG2837606.1 alpha/beta hydrolase [Photobacterium sp. WH77]MCG2845222.1 alpha/beta hydrolase [Photobacterium sp. WH80]
MPQLDCVEVNPKVKPTASVIWLHGLGSNGHDFEAILPELKLPANSPVRFIFPHAPSLPVTVNGGMVMPAWYDILEMGIGRKLDKEQLLESADKVADLIDRERGRGIASDRIILAGFSQGGAVAYQAALTYPHPLAGLLALSTYFPTAKSIDVAPANRQLPIEVMHGSFDPVVLPSMGKSAVEDLQELGFQPQWRVYPMEHQVCMQQVKDIADWLKHTLNIDN